ncbi:MAG: MFS transporter [Planctomycetes bacterium]|nr:MFS transporter [Planctomycetota bacterium]
MTTSNQSPAAPGTEAKLPWYRGLSRYHWFILTVCWMAWLFDTMDQQLFILARSPAMTALMREGTTKESITFYSGIVTMIMMLGWATGGILFGILGDRWGRAKTLVMAVMFYSVFTGLSALSVTWMDFAAFRFLTGLGVGGTFGAAVSFVAEVLPARSRTFALGFLQSLGAVGNMAAATISLLLLPPDIEIRGVAGWRLLFVVGILPAILVLLVMRRLKEPESWVRAKEAERRGEAHHKGRGMGSLRELFGDPRWRRNVIVGIILGLAGVMGLWGIGFWLPELVRSVIPAVTHEEKITQSWYVSLAMLLFNGGAAVATYGFAALMGWIGRRPSFALIFVAALASVIGIFGFMTHSSQVWWMAPLLGIGTLTIFGGYSIYFPELFPTRLRATGVGFCYNTARYLAATAPFTLGLLTTVYKDAGFTLLGSLGSDDAPFRYAAFTVAGVFVAGLLVLPFAPETKGKPLPE